MAQVPVDGLGAEVELLGDLRCGESLGGEFGDASLGGGEGVVAVRLTWRPLASADRVQRGPGAGGERGGPERLG